MKRFMFFILLVLVTLLTAGPACGEGILRVPMQHGDDRLMPLKAVEVSVQIQEQVAITTVRNTFEVLEDSINGMFHYRLPVNASVVSFAVWQDSVWYEYNLREGEQGGPGTGVGDNNDLRRFLGDNPFNIPMYRLRAGDFSIRMQWVELLGYDFGVTELMHPLDCGDWLGGDIDTVAIAVDINARRGILGLEQQSLEDFGEVERVNDFHYRARFYAEDFHPREDWLVDITFNQEDIGAWMYTHRSNPEAPGYFMLLIEPGIIDPDEQVRKRFTFVIDKSGSMNYGRKMEQAKEAVLACLQRLVGDDYFNVIAFDYSVYPFRQEMVPADANNLTQGRNFVNQLGPSGGTNIYDALMTAVGQEMEQGVANQVIFATDGEPTAGDIQDPNQIIEAVTAANEWGARIFSFGIGAAGDVDEAFLASLAQRNHGMAYVINPQDARIDSVIADFYRYLSTPALVNPEITFAEDLECDEIYPPELQDLGEGKQLLLFGRYNSFGDFNVELSGFAPNGDTTLTFRNIGFPEENLENEFVPRMWAKAVIDYLLEYLRIHGERGNEDVIDRIVALSLEYRILTPYTEFTPPPNNGVEDPRLSLVSAESTPQGARITWNFTGGAGVSFNVYRSNTPEGPYLRLNATPLTTASYLDEDIPAGAAAFYKVEALVDGGSLWSEVIAVGQLPVEAALDAPHPNPFNNATVIGMSLPKAGAVELLLFDLKGREIRTLYRGELTAGSHQFYLQAEGLPAGKYFVQLRQDGRAISRGVTLLK